MSAKSLWREISINSYHIDRLATYRKIPSNKPENIEFCQSASGPDLSLCTRYQTRHRFSLFVPPLCNMINRFCSAFLTLHSLICFCFQMNRKRLGEQTGSIMKNWRLRQIFTTNQLECFRRPIREH